MMHNHNHGHKINDSVLDELKPTCRFLAEDEYFGRVVRADTFYLVSSPETNVEAGRPQRQMMSNNGQEHPAAGRCSLCSTCKKY